MNTPNCDITFIRTNDLSFEMNEEEKSFRGIVNILTKLTIVLIMREEDNLFRDYRIDLYKSALGIFTGNERLENGDLISSLVLLPCENDNYVGVWCERINSEWQRYFTKIQMD